MLGLCAARVEDLRFHIEGPLVIDAERLVDQKAVRLERASFLVGEDIHSGLVLRVVEEIPVQMPLKGVEVIKDVQVEERVLGITSRLEFSILCLAATDGDALLAMAFDPLHKL